MTDPNQTDDDWAELARELACEPNTSHPEEAAVGDEFAGDLEDAQAGDSAETEAEGELEDAGAEGESESEPGEGQPGTGRKRRRRRRRRRKGGAAQPAEAAGGEAEVEATEAGEEADTVEAVDADDVFTEDVIEVEIEYAGTDSEEAEDAGGELLRELIANWNVPSWDDIVTGLHRP